uniref:J domain-containing protein n=1 Tax=Phocoena sinus TaxID=42100 RepID=A0A8C9B710_PHOSS
TSTRGQMKDYYKILGVDKNASEDEIKKPYRKRALMHHPDHHSGVIAEVQKEEEKKFKEVREAFTILSDPKKKTRYDKCGSNKRKATYHLQAIFSKITSDFSLGISKVRRQWDGMFKVLK